MLGFLEQVVEIVVNFFADIEGLYNWVLDALHTYFSMFTVFGASIPVFYGIYLPSGLVVVFTLLVSLSIVMAVLSAVGSNVRK